MRGNLELVLKNVARSEGGYSNHPKDPGGPTMRGVTLATYRAWCRKEGRPQPGIAELKRITTDEVREIFEDGYWRGVRGDDLPPGLDYAAADFAFNSGPGQAVKTLQRCLGVDADGKVGPKTLAAIRERDLPAELHALINKYCDERLAFMKRLSGWSSFSRGWTNRVAEVRTTSLRLARGAQVEPAVVVTETPAKASPKETTFMNLPGGKSAITAIGGALATGVTAAAGQLLDQTSTAEPTLIPWLIGGFVILTLVGSVFGATILRKRVDEEGTV